MTNRLRILVILANAAIDNHSLETRVSIEKLADYIIHRGVVAKDVAKWVDEQGVLRCSACHSPSPDYLERSDYGKKTLRSKRTDFCPCCGAKMSEE